MGREWYFNWGMKSSSKKKGVTAGGGAPGGGKSVEATPPAAVVAAATAAATAGGCMNAVLHMFDFHPLQLCLHPSNVDPLLQCHDKTTSKVNSGVEAPRNSLESLDDMVIGPPSLASIMKDDKFDSSHILGNRRDTKLKLVQAPRTKLEELSSSSETTSSPAGARTPNLVARLMGLEILPESTTTTPRSSTCQPLKSPHISSSTPPTRKIKTTSYNHINSPHSLPETPRTSSSTSRRRSMDFIDQHRLSLQINKENSILKEMEDSRPSCSSISTKRRGNNFEEECKSPGYYARQIMRQVKETVSRRVGVDITNTIGQRDKEIRRDEHLLSSNKPKKPSKSKSMSLDLDQDKCLLVLDESISNVALEKKVENVELNKFEGTKKKKSSLNKSSLKSMDSIKNNKKDEQFVRSSMRVHNGSSDKTCKRKPLSSSVPSISQRKLLEKQVASPLKDPTSTVARLSGRPCQRYLKEEVMHTPADPRDKRCKNASSISEFQYISRVLKCTGIDSDTPVSFTRWFSPSHPLDPTIFNNLEATHYISLSESSFHRKLIFHLVDEILGDLLKPCIEFKPRVFTSRGQKSHYNYYQQQQQMNGFQLVKTLCTKIRSFPSADCQTLQDIDALVEKDLPKSGVQNNCCYAIEEEEGEESIVSEIERDIMDSLVQEMVLLSLTTRTSYSLQRYVTTIR